MKLSEIPRKGRRNALLLMAGLGTAAALALAPIGAGVFEVGQAAAAAVPTTTTTTVVTSGTWKSTTGSAALVECPVTTNGGYTYVTITGATWIWAYLGQTGCKNTGNGPGAVPAGTTVTLSTTFTVPGIPQGATLTLAADNGATVTINGTVVATLPVGTNFEAVHPFPLTTYVGDFHQGTNTITIVGRNGTLNPQSQAGVIAKLTVLSTTTTTNLCKHTGWRQWNTPKFQNQGDCVSYFVGNGNDPTIPNTANS